MARCAGVVVLVWLLVGGAVCQQPRPMEASLDYSYLRLQVPNSPDPVNMHGIQLGFARNLNRRLSLVADFGSYYHCAAGCYADTSLARNWAFSLLAGPRVRFKTSSAVRPFLQASAGVLNIRYSDDFGVKPSPTGVGITTGTTISSTGAAVAAGGGLDWGTGRFFGRPFQVDYVRYTLAGQSHNTFRFSAGVRLQIGKVR